MPHRSMRTALRINIPAERVREFESMLRHECIAALAIGEPDGSSTYSISVKALRSGSVLRCLLNADRRFRWLNLAAQAG